MERVTADYFPEMIRTLRKHEEVMLFSNILEITAQEADAVTGFLKNEYDHEALNHPHSVPVYDPNAACWAAKTVYTSAQLILYREHKEKDLALLLPDLLPAPDAAAMLSADLCLRFLPDMIVQLKLIDSEDPLIGVLEGKLRQWHYSGIHHTLDIQPADFTAIETNPCLHQLYCYRIIEHKKISLARHPVFKDAISAQLGLYGHDLWNEFILTTSSTLHE